MSRIDEITKNWNFHAARELEDGTIVAFGPLIFTTAVYVDVNSHGWGSRFCFEHFEDAAREYLKLVSGDDEPIGYIARRDG